MSAFNEEQFDDLDFEFDDRLDTLVNGPTIPAPPPLEAFSDSSLDEDAS